MKTLIAAAAVFGAVSPALAAPRPAVGDTAPTVTLTSTDGQTVDLAESFGEAKTVLVVLRGYPGYQCPLCTRQVGELLGKADEIKKANAKVLFVYPGPAESLTKHAEAFFKNQTIPDHVAIVTDPDYTFTNAYDLRWNARNETAYPSTFVLDSKRNVLYRKVSSTHGDRAPIADVLKALPKN